MLVVDTDVVSYLFKQDTRGDLYKPHLQGHRLLISPMTRAELEVWALEHNWGLPRREAMRVHLKQFMLVPFNEELCVNGRRLQIALAGRGARSPARTHG